MHREIAEVLKTTTDGLELPWKLWRNQRALFQGRPLFVTPPWLQAWKDTLGQDATLCVLGAAGPDGAEGYCPLTLRQGVGLFAGDPEVCDYFDVVVPSGMEDHACRAFLHGAHLMGIATLDLFPVRPDSVVMTHWVPLCRAMGRRVLVETVDVTVEMPLPGTWEDYLLSLSGKQRHEVRRKLRRLEETASVDFRVVTTPTEIEAALEVFFRLFRSNREDKARFLTPGMRTYLETLCRTMSEHGMLRLSFLDMDGFPAASAICFDDGKSIFLYNNGYNAAFAHVSVGLMLTVWTIKDAVELGRGRYEFLRGDETYKFRLGGREVPLSRVRIAVDAESGSI